MDLQVLEQYGVTLQNALDPESLPKLRGAYVSLVKELEESKESVEKEGDTVLVSAIAEVRKNEETVKLAESVTGEIRRVINEAYDIDPQVSFLLVDLVQTVKSDLVIGERDYQLSKIKRAQPTKLQVTEDFEQKKDSARSLAEAIRAIFVLVKTSLPTTKKFAEAFPTKKSEASDSKGELMPDLPKLPRTPGDSGGNVGRGAKVRRLRFSWAQFDSETETFGEHELLPAGSIVTDVAHDYVSDRSSGFVADFRTIKDAIEKSGQEMFGNEMWTVTFPTGQLSGWLPQETE